jgi:GNAT superfamily N-acetyltransferase
VTTFTFRPYRSHAEDAQDVLAYLSGINQHPNVVADAHPGDFIWRRFRIAEARTSDEVALWTDANGRIVAMGWFNPPHEFEATIDPGYVGTPPEADLYQRIAAWAGERYQSGKQADTKPLGLTLRADDAVAQRAVAELGFRFSGETWFASNAQRLDGPVPVPSLPDGYRILAMTDDADLAERVELHRDVWAPSKFTLEGYRMLRTAPLYRSDLDLVVRAPDGRYASYLIAWWDPASRTGLLEPVGARSAFRRLGLTKALIQETLRRFQALGATRAYVNSRAVDPPANALYRSAGFHRIAEWQWWTMT